MKKRLFFSALVLTILSLSASAQKDSSGIYKTAADFQQGKLSYAINYKTGKHTINDNLLLRGSEIKVKHEGKSYILAKAETYGYRDTKGVDFRFVDNKPYRVLSKGEGVILYVYQSPVPSAKGNLRYTSRYYFSKDIPSLPLELTKENLKAAYPNNHKFHDALDATFKDDKDLAAYDSFHKMYKVNHLLSVNQ